MRSLILSLSFSLLGACTHLKSEVVDVDGRSVEVVRAGEGPTTVVFESGLGDGWRKWDTVATDLSEDASVFAYSRPGYGRSDDMTTPRDPAQIVEELRGLLAAQNVASPYVLVGHSNGGTYMELFAKSHPEEVSGVVLVDPRPKDFLEECEREDLDMCGVPDSVLATQSDVVQAEYNSFPMASDEITGEFGAYPVRVLTSTVGGSDARMALWRSMHADLVAGAADGQQIVLDGAGHNLQLERPNDVADAIRSVLPQ
jgi:pimeloyl-ACP methyl ester carboxylesterase